MTRLGHLHIPKTAGSSLNNAIFKSQLLIPYHISKATYPRKNTLIHKLACNTPYLPGHIFFTELKNLHRDFIFSVFRDPRKRLISLYTYAVGRSKNEKALKKHPGLSQYADITFYQYLEKAKPMNKMSELLFTDIKNYSLRLERQRKYRVTSQFNTLIAEGLKRFDVIYACSIQQVLDDLHCRGFIPKTKEIFINKSKENIDFGYVGTKKEFIEKINQYVWLDMLTYKTAQSIFPETMPYSIATDDEFILEMETRFNIKFNDL